MSRFAADLLLAGVLLAAYCAAAAQTSLIVTLGSQHLNGGNYCETNKGAGLEYGATLRTLGGFYQNSLCRTSWYGGASYQPWAAGKWRAGAVAMLVTGYESPIAFAAGAVIAYAGVANLIWFPNKRGDFTAGVIGLQMELARW